MSSTVELVATRETRLKPVALVQAQSSESHSSLKSLAHCSTRSKHKPVEVPAAAGSRWLPSQAGPAASCSCSIDSP